MKQSTCPVCDIHMLVPQDIEASEIISCTDCQSRLVVEKVENQNVTLAKAPDVEEDWGE